MRVSTTYRLAGFSTLVLILALPSYLALADAGDVVKPSSEAAGTTYGRAGGQAYFSTAQPPRTPQALVDAYDNTKGYVEHTYEKSKEFLIDSAHGRASQELARENRAWQQGEASRRPVTSGTAIGAFGRAGIQSSLNTAEPAQPPQLLSNAYEKTKEYVKHTYERTKEFLTESTQRQTTQQSASYSGS